ncbi:MAG TPA: VanZ family protein, partial [Burkholderiaceae bacterium]
MNRPLPFLLMAALIAYGSLFPFEFHALDAQRLDAFLHQMRWWSSRGDVLGNIVLFVPMGLSGWFAFAGSARRRALLCMASGLPFAMLLQLIQLWLPMRDAAVGDVLWNTVGLTLGLLAAPPLANWRPAATSATAPLALIGLWAAVQCLPLVPSLDLTLLATQLHALIATGNWAWADLLGGLLPLLALACLMQQALGRARTALLLPLLICALIWVQLFLVQSAIVPAKFAGWALGLLLWPWFEARLAAHPARAALLMLVAITVAALAPYELRDAPGTLHWLPFETALSDSMLNNARALGSSLTQYAITLYLIRLATGHSKAFTIGLAGWVALLEVVQLMLPQRTSDLTEALLVLLA